MSVSSGIPIARRTRTQTHTCVRHHHSYHKCVWPSSIILVLAPFIVPSFTFQDVVRREATRKQRADKVLTNTLKRDLLQRERERCDGDVSLDVRASGEIKGRSGRSCIARDSVMERCVREGGVQRVRKLVHPPRRHAAHPRPLAPLPHPGPRPRHFRQLCRVSRRFPSRCPTRHPYRRRCLRLTPGNAQPSDARRTSAQTFPPLGRDSCSRTAAQKGRCRGY